MLLLALAVSPFQSSIQPLPAAVRAKVRATAWHPGCPVPLSDLRVLTVSYRGFDGRTYSGQLVVNRSAAARSQSCSASSTESASRSAT